MQDKKQPSGWDRVLGIFFGVALCGFVLASNGSVLGVWGGLMLTGIGTAGVILLAMLRPKRGCPKA
jgi:hypothetical protein